MAVYEASKTRAVSIEIKDRIVDLYLDVLSIWQECTSWQLNGSDPNLPTPYQVRMQIEAYEALTVPLLRLTEWITALKLAQPADFLSYPPPPVFFDGGTGLFDGGGNPNP